MRSQKAGWSHQAVDKLKHFASTASALRIIMGSAQLRLCAAPHNRKVTNGFRSEWGAKVYADLCSIVGTGRRNGRSAIAAIRNALAAPAAASA
jgi:hypothetical protein